MATSAATVALTGQLCWPPSQRPTAGEQPVTTAMIGNHSGRESKLKRFSNPQRACWWRRLHEKVTGVAPVSLYCGGGRWSTTQSCYGGPNDAVKGSRDAQTHCGTFQMLEVVDYGRSWPQSRRFRRVAAKGNGESPVIRTSSTRFLPPGGPRSHCGAPELHGETLSGL
jgi:hypothetical protein